MRNIEQLNMKHNKAYRAGITKRVDNKQFWNETLNGMTASEWVEYWKQLRDRLRLEKVSRKSFCDDNNYSTPRKKFSYFFPNNHNQEVIP